MSTWGTDPASDLPARPITPCEEDEVAFARESLGLSRRESREMLLFARGHQHIWSTTSPMRCVECRRYLRPWWRRVLDRVRRPR